MFTLQNSLISSALWLAQAWDNGVYSVALKCNCPNCSYIGFQHIYFYISYLPTQSALLPAIHCFTCWSVVSHLRHGPASQGTDYELLSLNMADEHPGFEVYITDRVLALLKKRINCIDFIYGLVCIQDGLCIFSKNDLTADFWQYCAVFTATWLGLRILVMPAEWSINKQIQMPQPS